MNIKAELMNAYVRLAAVRHSIEELRIAERELTEFVNRLATEAAAASNAEGPTAGSTDEESPPERPTARPVGSEPEPYYREWYPE